MNINISGFIALIILLFAFNSIVKPELNAIENSGYEIGTEGEIPILIKYSNKICGFSSDTLYIGIPLERSESSTHSLTLSFNATIYEYVPLSYYDSTKGYTVAMGWWPINPLVWVLAAVPGDEYINLFSPAAGYSYTKYFSDIIGITAKFNAGVAHARLTKPDDQRTEEIIGQNAKMLEGYEAMKDIDDEYGFRLNGKVRFHYKKRHFMFGLTAGYTQYIFKDADFNSIDLGTFISILF